MGNGFDRVNSLTCVGSKCPSECVSTAACNSLGGIVSGTTCFLCGTGQTFNNVYLNCDITILCGSNEYFNGSICKCSPNFYDVNGQCLPSCGLNAYLDSQGTCQCSSVFGNKNNAPYPASTSTSTTCNKVTPCPSL